MKKTKVGIVCVFLAFLVGAYFHKQGIQLGARETSVIENERVSWDIELANGKEKRTVTFTLYNEQGEELRGVNDEVQNQFRVLIVDHGLVRYEDMHPTFLGKGTFTFSYKFLPSVSYTIFLYKQDGHIREQLARTDIPRKEAGAENDQHSLTADPLLTTKIGAYDVSLLFNALKAKQKQLLTFQFQTKKGESIRFQSPSGEQAHLFIIDENRKHFLTALPLAAKTGKQLQFEVMFPEEGLYKLWGTIYLNGKMYEKPFVVQVGK